MTEQSLTVERNETVRWLLESLQVSHPSVQPTWTREQLIRHCIAMEPNIAAKSRIAMEILASSDAAILTDALLRENRTLAQQTTALANKTKELSDATWKMAVATFAIAVLTLISTGYTIWKDSQHAEDPEAVIKAREQAVLKREMEIVQREKDVATREGKLQRQEKPRSTDIPLQPKPGKSNRK